MSDQAPEITITTEDPRSEAGNLLIRLLSAELSGRYPEDGADGNSDYDIEVASQQPGAAFVVAWREDKPVGCGALRPFATGIAEIKRMYVGEEYRGMGIAKRILSTLEEVAARNGNHTVCLETGIRQPEAIALYERAGYIKIPCWEKYADCPLSVCYEKVLQPREG